MTSRSSPPNERSAKLSEAAARAAYLSWASVLDRIEAALSAETCVAILVKGAALAHTVYARPWHRAMSDIDLLAPDPPKVGRALAAHGFLVGRTDPERRWSTRFLGERHFLPESEPRVLVEVHETLDKIVARPMPVHEIARRARPLRPGSPLLLPANEDQLLLVVMHAANSDFDHPVAWPDLGALLLQPLDLGLVVARAGEYRLRTALYLCMQHLAALGVAVPPALSAPPPLFGRLFAREPARRRSGLSWVVGQTALRDDPHRWLAGALRYAGLRAAERLLGPELGGDPARDLGE